MTATHTLGQVNQFKLIQKWSAPAVLMEPAPKDREQIGFNWSYNLNKDLFWSRGSNKVSSPGVGEEKHKSVPSTPTVALPPAQYRERRGLGALGKQRSGQET